MRSIKLIATTLFLAFVLFIQSCVKPAYEEKYGPLTSKSCTDGVLNQGEYFIDCGGPCTPCALNTFVNFKVIDSTWSIPNATDLQVNSNWETAIFSGDIITIQAVDTIMGIGLSFSIDKNWRGVHEIDSFPVTDLFFGLGYFVGLEKGVISIKNVDEVNGYISGEFSFNCKPDTNSVPYGKRLSILEGEFKDIPTIEGL